MDVNELLLDLYGRVDEHVEQILDGLDPDLLLTSSEPGTNPIAWLVWHLARVQDATLSELVEEEQLWVKGDWAPRFGLEPDPANSGYGHTPEQVAAVRPDGVEVLGEYFDAVSARTRALLEEWTEADLDRIVDESWDPPVSLGVRLISAADDCIQHAGQAKYLRGVLEARDN
jgi:hypothetical protein